MSLSPHHSQSRSPVSTKNESPNHFVTSTSNLMPTLNSTSNANNNINSIPATTTATTTTVYRRCPKLILKILSHDENGKESVILFDPEFVPAQQQPTTNQNSSSPSNQQQQQQELLLFSPSGNMNNSSMLVERVSSAVGGGSRRNVAAAAMMSGLKYQLILPAANAVTVSELQRILVSLPGQDNNNNPREDSSFTSSSSLSDIPVERQMIRFEGRSIIEPSSRQNLSSNNNLNKTIADVLSVFDASSAMMSNIAVHRTIHLYDAGFSSSIQHNVLKNFNNNSNLTTTTTSNNNVSSPLVPLEVGQVLAAPRWVAPIYNNNPATATTTPATNPTNMMSVPRQQQEVEPQFQQLTTTSSSIPRESSVSGSRINDNNNSSPQEQQRQQQTLLSKEQALLLSRSSLPLSPQRKTDPNVELEHEKTLRNVAKAEEYVTAAVAAEADKLGNDVTIQDLRRAAQGESNEVTTAMLVLERARAEAQRKMLLNMNQIRREEEEKRELKEFATSRVREEAEAAEEQEKERARIRTREASIQSHSSPRVNNNIDNTASNSVTRLHPRRDEEKSIIRSGAATVASGASSLARDLPMSLPRQQHQEQFSARSYYDNARYQQQPQSQSQSQNNTSNNNLMVQQRRQISAPPIASSDFDDVQNFDGNNRYYNNRRNTNSSSLSPSRNYLYPASSSSSTTVLDRQAPQDSYHYNQQQQLRREQQESQNKNTTTRFQPSVHHQVYLSEQKQHQNLLQQERDILEFRKSAAQQASLQKNDFDVHNFDPAQPLLTSLKEQREQQQRELNLITGGPPQPRMLSPPAPLPLKTTTTTGSVTSSLSRPSNSMTRGLSAASASNSNFYSQQNQNNNSNYRHQRSSSGISQASSASMGGADPIIKSRYYSPGPSSRMKPKQMDRLMSAVRESMSSSN